MVAEEVSMLVGKQSVGADGMLNEEIWDIHPLVPSLSFWARGRVVTQPPPTLTYNTDTIRH